SEAPATIIYTSRTLGRPKGVTLSHRNILENAWQAAKCLGVRQNDLFLSFLSPSHALERTVGYYLPMVAGATIAYVRSVQSLNSDLNALNPTAIVAVPRIYERFYMRIQSNVKERSKLFQRLFAKTVSLGWQVFEYQQKRGKWQIVFLLWPFFKYFIARPLLTKHLGGHLRIAISGGARLNPEVARFLVSLGVPVLQGYGLTETSPIISVNTLQDNLPASVGRPLPNLEVRIGDQDELQVRGPSIMLGYWNNTAATAQILDAEGWLYTGDQVHFQDGHIVITGRLKEIIALTNGEKVPPADMEIAIGTDPLFEQVIVIGESKPYLSALVVLNATAWATLAQVHGLPEDPKFAVDNAQVEKLLLRRVSELLHDFPGYAQVRRLAVLNDSWNLEEDLLSKTLKLRRKLVLERFKHVIELLYKGHSLQI
ncbi:MAG: long-chain fatty acid--CoA ligase, partial [Beggiatoa sp. IS2]